MDMNTAELCGIINTIPQQLVVCDIDGNIVFANQNWIDFGLENGIPQSYDWLQQNYLSVCREAIDCSDAQAVIDGFVSVATQQCPQFTYEYPCHSPTSQRWFKLLITHLPAPSDLILITHEQITARIEAQNECERTKREHKRIRRIAQLAFIDSLSQVLNRRGMEQTIDQLMAQSQRYNHELSLMLIDIDHFKKINDEHGHSVGDEVICQFAKCLKDNVRELDIVGRWGGDEFIIVFPETNANVAMRFGERIRENVEGHECDLNVKLSMSYGAAQLLQVMSAKELIETADRALYEAKKLGRNRGVLYSKLLDN